MSAATHIAFAWRMSGTDDPAPPGWHLAARVSCEDPLRTPYFIEMTPGRIEAIEAMLDGSLTMLGAHSQNVMLRVLLDMLAEAKG